MNNSRDINKICEIRKELNDDYKLKSKYKIYHELQQEYDWVLVDNNATLENTKAQIIQQLKALEVIK